MPVYQNPYDTQLIIDNISSLLQHNNGQAGAYPYHHGWILTDFSFLFEAVCVMTLAVRTLQADSKSYEIIME
ncbi:hypothetical protein ACTXT7_016588 [Hymenolepis weldensis]